MVVAYPFVKVEQDTKGLVPVATRAPGVLAVIGFSDAGTIAADTPSLVDSAKTAESQFGEKTPLGRALALALMQSPGPSTIYGLKVATDDEAGWDKALAVLESIKDVTFVAAAGHPLKADADPVLAKLKKHCEDSESNGQPRIGVVHVDPEITRSPSYAADVVGLAKPMETAKGRMVVIVARGAVAGDASADVAAAAAAAIAGRPPETSMVLKVIRGFTIRDEYKLTPTEITALSTAQLIPIIDPVLIPGESLHFAEGTTTSADVAFKYIDVVRLLDDMDFALKASLIGLIGDARITRSGVNAVRRQLEAVLDGYVDRQAITTYLVQIDLLAILDRPELSWTPAERKKVADARGERQLLATVLVVIGPAIHQLVINLQPHLAMPAQVA